MKSKYIITGLLLFFLSISKIFAQLQTSSDRLKPTYFISVNYGIQISGIKDEDFVSSNLSPLLNVSLSREITPLFSIQVGYKGFYFKYIDDAYTHKYNFFYIEPVFNINNFFSPSRDNNNWNFLIYAGPGLFSNKLHNKTQVCINTGFQNNYLVKDNIKITLDISSIVGWKIYQRDEDILPGISVGITYIFYNLVTNNERRGK